MAHVLIVRRVPLDVSMQNVHDLIGTWTEHTLPYSTWMSSTNLPGYKTKQAYINFKSLEHAWAALDMLSDQRRMINNAELLISDPEPRRAGISRTALRFTPAAAAVRQPAAHKLPELEPAALDPTAPEPAALGPTAPELAAPEAAAPETAHTILRPTPVYMQPANKRCFELNIGMAGELFWDAYRACTELTCNIAQQCNYRVILNTQEATVTFLGLDPSFVLMPILQPLFTDALKRCVYNGPFGPRMSIAQHMSEYLYDLLGYLHRNYAVATRVVHEPEFGIEVAAVDMTQADEACSYMDAIVKMWSAA